MLESKILETRLINKESSFVGSSVSKCANKFQQFITNKKQALELNSNPDSNIATPELIDNKSTDLNISFENFMREIVQYKLDIHRVSSMQKAYFNQIQCYDTLENEIRSKILKTENDIHEYEINFGNEKLIRLHREQLEVKATEVNTLPSKTILKRKLTEMETNIVNLENNIQMANTKITARYKQFQILLDCLNQLNDKLPLIEDNEGLGTNIGTSSGGHETMNVEEEEEEVRERDNDRETSVAAAVTNASSSSRNNANKMTESDELNENEIENDNLLSPENDQHEEGEAVEEEDI